MDIVSGRQIGKQICKALGIDAAKVRRIAIDIPASEAVIVTVERFIEPSAANNLRNALDVISETYTLVKESEP